MAMSVSPIRVAAELAELAEPWVGALDHPAQSEPEWPLCGSVISGLGASLDVQIGEARINEWSTDAGVVVAPVEVQGLDVTQQTFTVDVLEGRTKEFEIVAAGTVDRHPMGIP